MNCIGSKKRRYSENGREINEWKWTMASGKRIAEKHENVRATLLADMASAELKDNWTMEKR